MYRHQLTVLVLKWLLCLIHRSCESDQSHRNQDRAKTCSARSTTPSVLVRHFPRSFCGSLKLLRYPDQAWQCTVVWFLWVPPSDQHLQSLQYPDWHAFQALCKDRRLRFSQRRPVRLPSIWPGQNLLHSQPKYQYLCRNQQPVTCEFHFRPCEERA